jgi:hypothetical protein
MNALLVIVAFVALVSLIVPTITLVDVDAQKALPQNIFCIMTVDNTIDCHESEQACEIVEGQQQLMNVEIPSNCSSFTGNIAGTVSDDFGEDNDVDNINPNDNGENNEQSETNEQSNLDGCNTNIGCVNEVEEAVNNDEPMGSSSQQHEEESGSSDGDGDVSGDDE